MNEQWQIQEAKQRFSELVRCALERGPQVVTRRGEPTVVVLSVDEYDRLRPDRDDLKQYLLDGPDLSMLDLEPAVHDPR